MYEGFEKLKEQMKNNKFKNLALTIAKYRKFKTSAILKNLPKDINFGTNATQYKYAYAGVKYYEDGIRDKSCPRELYDELDNCKAKCIQPLTPLAKDKRQSRIKISKPKITIAPVKVKNIKYGVLINDDTINVLDEEKDAKVFIRALKFMNKDIKAKVVVFEIKEEKEI